MRNDVGIVEVLGEHELDGNRALAILAALLACDRECADIGEPALVDVHSCGSEHLIAVEVKELDRLGVFQEQRVYGRGGLVGLARDLAARSGTIEASCSSWYRCEDIEVDVAFAWSSGPGGIVRAFANQRPIKASHVTGLFDGLIAHA